MVRISLIGAGSGCFSIGLIRDLCASEYLSGSTVSLMDINTRRLDAVHALCVRYTKEIGGNLSFEKTTNRIESLKGAGIVINVALTAPHQRLKDGWVIADKYGFGFGGSYHIKYDEAFWVNFYQFKFFEELTEDILRYCPNAWHLMVSNPVLAGTTHLQRKYPQSKMVGLCHGYAHAYGIAEALGYKREDVTFEMSGPNHFVWLNRGHVKNKDIFEALEENIRAGNPENLALGKIHTDFYRRHGVIGIGDTLSWTGACWPWFYHSDDETRQEFNDYEPMEGWHGYFDWVDQAAKDVIALANNPSASVVEFLESVSDDDLMVPLVESLACNIPRVLYVNLLNRGGWVPGVPADFAVEVQALCQKDEIRPIHANPLPRTMLAYILRDRVAPVEMELEAFRTGKMSNLEELLLMDKWAVSIKQVRGFIQEIMDLPYHAEMKAHFVN